ncbi:MAG: IPExxxVDY family protein [Bacteroidota bacterium]
MKNIKLKISDKADDNFLLAGIVSTENDYKISWAINQALGIELVRNEPLSLYSEKSPDQLLYPVFYFSDGFTEYHLITGKVQGISLLDEFPDADYLLKIKGQFNEQDLPGLLKKTGELTEVLANFPVPVKQLKQKSLEKLTFLQ